MKRIALTSILALAIATPVLASDQLAKNAGVEPGVYTNNELIELIDARQDQDWSTVRAILNGSTVENAGDDRTSAGHVQLADLLDVDPAAYSTNELTQLRAARQEGDWSRVRYLEENASASDDANTTFSTNNPTQSAGHVQLARSLDVDPADFTTNELLLLKSATEEGDWSRVNYLLKNAG